MKLIFFDKNAQLEKRIIELEQRQGAIGYVAAGTDLGKKDVKVINVETQGD